MVCPIIQPADDGPLLQSKSASGSSIEVLGPNSRGDIAHIMRSGQCVAGALGAAAVKQVVE